MQTLSEIYSNVACGGDFTMVSLYNETWPLSIYIYMWIIKIYSQGDGIQDLGICTVRLEVRREQNRYKRENIKKGELRIAIMHLETEKARIVDRGLNEVVTSGNEGTVKQI